VFNSDEALRVTLRIALGAVTKEDAVESDREAVLVTCAERLRGPEGEAAARSLFHMREQRREQLMLSALLDGVGSKGGSAS
jgi:hypothetical protein